jgi:hypothetical protein
MTDPRTEEHPLAVALYVGPAGHGPQVRFPQSQGPDALAPETPTRGRLPQVWQRLANLAIIHCV